MKFLFIIPLLFFLLDCSRSTQTKEPRIPKEQSAADNWDQDLDQAKQDLLALTCDESMKTSFEAKINSQSQAVTKSEMLNIINNMKKNISCG